MSTAGSETVLADDIRDRVRLLTINRPDRRNALDHATYVALAAGIRTADDDPEVRVIVVTGAGGTFTSGNDIADFRREPRPEPRGGTLLFEALIAARKPVIAAVEGHAVGIGVTMLLHCDLAYAGAGSRFRLPFVALGISPEGASSYLLPRLAGDKRAAELLLTAEAFDAVAAQEAGLINRVVEAGTALEHALDRATVVASLPRTSVEATKSLLRAARREPVRAALDRESPVFTALLASEEAQSVFAGFARRS